MHLDWDAVLSSTPYISSERNFLWLSRPLRSDRAAAGAGASNAGILTLSGTSGGATLAQSAQYTKGVSNYNLADMYFPFSITFVLLAGQGRQIELSSGQNGLGYANFMYSLYALGGALSAAMVEWSLPRVAAQSGPPFRT